MIIIYIYNFIISLKIIFIFFDAKLKLVSSCTDTRVRSFRQEIPDLRRLPAIDDKKSAPALPAVFLVVGQNFIVEWVGIKLF